MSDLEVPRDLIALVLKNGDTLCVNCVEKEKSLLDDDANTVVLSGDDWKSEIVPSGSTCDRCHEEFAS